MILPPLKYFQRFKFIDTLQISQKFRGLFWFLQLSRNSTQRGLRICIATKSRIREEFKNKIQKNIFTFQNSG